MLAMPSRPCWVMYIHFVWVTPQWFAGWHSFFGATLNTGETWKFTNLFQVRFEIWKGARQPVKQEWPLRKLSRCIEFRVFQYILYRVMKITSKISIHIHVYITSHRNSPLQRSRLNSWRVQSSRPLFVGQPRITWEKRKKTGESEYENMQHATSCRLSAISSKDIPTYNHFSRSCLALAFWESLGWFPVVDVYWFTIAHWFATKVWNSQFGTAIAIPSSEPHSWGHQSAMRGSCSSDACHM